jgi:phosphoribosylglycinamide formyltransferase-1
MRPRHNRVSANDFTGALNASPAAPSPCRPQPFKLGVLASGAGTTLQALIDACAAGRLQAEVALVISNNAGSGALVRARAAGIDALHLSAATEGDADRLDSALCHALRSRGCALVVLAGYMKRIGPRLLADYAGALVNTHPSLLPRHGGQGMYGRHVHAAVLAAGDAETGVTIHHVDGDYDTGQVLAQARVPVLAGDDADTLAARVQAVERRLLCETLQQLIAARCR